MNDIFLFLQKCGLANYADDSTMYASDKRVSTIVDSLSHEFTILPKWFYNNFMVLNPEKCSFMLLDVDIHCKPTWYVVMKFLNTRKQEKVLGVTLDNTLNFATNLLNITKNATKKLNTLTRVQKYMTTDQKLNLPTVR